MNWFFINSGAMTGQENMDFDIQLAKNCKDGETYFRLYRWAPYCISIGANQSHELINAEKIIHDNIDLVTRPTGGRAILHSEELTYSVVMKTDSVATPQKIYKEINNALLSGLGIYDSKLANADLEKNQPDFLKIYQNENPFACFSTSAKSEIKYSSKKLIGSAQRKLGNTVLQHGSILCGSYHHNIVNYLNISSSEKFSLAEELMEKTIEIESILKTSVDYSKLIISLKSGFEKYFETKFYDLNIENKKELV
ncbi:MAG: hypothetical protein C0425_05970 [Chlorobiaceae bacterium]|nr:hypothetical protein [Chlorobiaceae bacterium]MBA4309866.1 hypothetical protein [Chlorobiaceae bacterium]